MTAKWPLLRCGVCPRQRNVRAGELYCRSCDRSASCLVCWRPPLPLRLCPRYAVWKSCRSVTSPNSVGFKITMEWITRVDIFSQLRDSIEFLQSNCTPGRRRTAPHQSSVRVRGAASAAPTSPCCRFDLLPIRYALAAETLQSCAPLQPVLADVHPAHPHATRVLETCAGCDAANGTRSGRSEAPDVRSVQCGDHANRKPLRFPVLCKTLL